MVAVLIMDSMPSTRQVKVTPPLKYFRFESVPGEGARNLLALLCNSCEKDTLKVLNSLLCPRYLWSSSTTTGKKQEDSSRTQRRDIPENRPNILMEGKGNSMAVKKQQLQIRISWLRSKTYQQTGYTLDIIQPTVQ